MTPTLSGRIQTRLVMIFGLGSLWTLLIGPLLPRPGEMSLGSMYGALFTALVVVGVLGVGWECAYHGLQQYRWEKDWPTLFGLLTGVPEAILAYAVLDAGLPWDVRPGPPGDPGAFPLAAFIWMFTTTWLLVWATVNGPLQIVFLRWRYRGGRFDSRW